MRSAVVLLASLPAFVTAQCGMTSTFSVTNSCSPGPSYVFTGMIAGGVAPYSIQIQDGQWTPINYWSTNTSSSSWSIATTVGVGHQGWAALTVTDNVGCVFNTVNTSLPAQYVQVPTYGLFQDCQGWHLDWTGWNTGSGAAPCPVWNTNTMFWVDMVSGTLTSAWTQISPSIWRYNLAIAPGNHSLYINNPVQCTGREDCFVQVSFTIAPNAVTPGDCGANVSIRAALQGPLPSGTVMHDSLRVKSLVPTTQPYTALGYSYTAYSGALTISPALLTTTGNNAIVDWVVAELRNSANSAQVLFSKPALIQRDGDVVDLDGDSYLNFPLAGGNYYVALRHRNHLGIMTSTTSNLTWSPTVVDFRVASTACYGTNARVAVGSVQCLWSGDANGDATIAYTGANNDRDVVLGAIGGVVPTNTLSNVYDRRDVNLDGTVKYTGAANDRDVILQTIGGSVPTNTRVQQLP